MESMHGIDGKLRVLKTLKVHNSMIFGHIERDLQRLMENDFH